MLQLGLKQACNNKNNCKSPKKGSALCDCANKGANLHFFYNKTCK